MSQQTFTYILYRYNQPTNIKRTLTPTQARSLNEKLPSNSYWKKA